MFKGVSRKIYNKIFGVRCEGVPYFKYFSEEDYLNLKSDEFSIKSKDEEVINGKFYYKDNYDKDILIVLVHGFGSGHNAYMQEIDYLTSNNFKVLAYDNVGTCLSTGDSIKGFLESISNLDDVLKYLFSCEEFKNKEIYLIGHSMGALAAGSILSLYPNIKKAVLLSPPRSVDELFKELIKVKSIYKNCIKFEKEKYPKYYSLNVLDGLNNSKTKVMVYASKDDDVINFDSNFSYLKNNSKRSDVIFLTLNDKGHNPTYKEESVKALNELQNKIAKYSIEEKINYTKDLDFKKFCELDEEVMNEIVEFLQKSDFVVELYTF